MSGSAHLARLAAGARSTLRRELSTTELALFSSYIELLATWQRTHRLIGSSDPEWIVDNLLVDSLLFAGFLPSPTTSLLDLGSGAGIPGIPLKIVSPLLRMTLLDGRRRRASFLSTAARVLGLDAVSVVGSRAEVALVRDPRLNRGFQAVVSRCTGELEEVVRLALPFLRPGGRLLIAGPPSPSPSAIPGHWATVEHPIKRRSRTFFVWDSPPNHETG